MPGQIPAYGEHFELGRSDYDVDYASSTYFWRGDRQFYLRAEHGSKRWWIWHGSHRLNATPYPSLTRAMAAFLAVAASLQLADQRVA